MSQTSQQTTPTCALGLTSADLSAWRDDALAPDETARIGAHSESCSACQQRLRGFAMVAATLQAQQVPSPDERLWQGVLAALAAERQTTSADSITGEHLVPDESGERNPIPPSLTPPRNWRRRALGTLAAVATIALVVVGFARLFQSGAQNRPSQAFTVTWRQVKLPAAVGETPGANARLSVFHADGSVAWLCQSGTKPAPGPLRVWRTSDGGATWQVASAPASVKTYECQITLDQVNPDVALLQYGYIPDAKPATVQVDYLITFDSGVSWQDGSSFQFAREFAMHNGAIYAVRETGEFTTSLEVSADGGTTWNVLDNPIHSQKLLSDYFWINPTSGDLLVEAHSIPSPASDSYFGRQTTTAPPGARLGSRRQGALQPSQLAMAWAGRSVRWSRASAPICGIQIFGAMSIAAQTPAVGASGPASTSCGRATRRRRPARAAAIRRTPILMGRSHHWVSPTMALCWRRLMIASMRRARQPTPVSIVFR